MTTRDLLQQHLRAAMLRRDRPATSALRIALAALDNAGAVPTGVRAGAVESSAVGVGATDTSRRELTSAEERAILEGELAELVAVGDAGAEALRSAIAELPEG